jgi:hypothetical protein
MARAPAYGDIDESDLVHDEIRELGSNVRRALQQRQPSDCVGLTAQLQAFGPSAESKAMMAAEASAAVWSQSSGVYATYRLAQGGKHGPTDCFRMGPSSVCFCGHQLASHKPVRASKPLAPGCSDCLCPAFRYVPASPAEIGEAFLLRRKDFKASEWFPKCRCGHGPRDHDPRTLRCNACRRCFRFEGAFACLACDGRFEDHETVFESQAERRAAGRTTGAHYGPLANEAPELRQLVFGSDAPLGGGPPQSRTAITAAQPARVQTKAPGSVSSLNPRGDEALGSFQPSMDDRCAGCGSAFRTITSKFCSSCGRKRGS